MNPLDAPMPDMEYAPVSPWPTILKYGLIGSMVIILIGVGNFLIGTNSDSFMMSTMITVGLSALNLIVYAVIMIFSIKEYRNRHSQGYITLGKGMIISYGSAMLMGTIGLLFTLLYLIVIDPEYMNRLTLRQYENMGMGDAMSHQLTDFYTPSVIALSQAGSFVLGAIVGAALSLIISAVMKKERPFNSL